MVTTHTNQSISIHRQGVEVIVTMTAQQAQLMASSIWLGDRQHRGWLNDLSEALESAADGTGAFGADQPSMMLLEIPEDAAADASASRAMAAGVDRDIDALFSAEALTAALGSATETAVAEALRQVATETAQAAKDAVTVAAEKTAQAAETARRARALATTTAANAMAEVVRRTAASVKLQAEGLAEAARLSGDTDDAAATRTAYETALAAALVARDAAEAALEVASVAADDAMALELEVAVTAADVAAVAEDSALRLEAHARAEAAEAAEA